MTYATTPPGRAESSAVRSRSRCRPPRARTSSGVRRQRASGLRRRAPSPEQGTSAITRSNPPSRQAGLVPSATMTPTGAAWPASRLGPRAGLARGAGLARWARPGRLGRPGPLPTGQGAPGARVPRRPAGASRHRPRARPAAAPCRRDQRTGPASARRATPGPTPPVATLASATAASWLASSWTPALPSATAPTAAGSPSAR